MALDRRNRLFQQVLGAACFLHVFGPAAQATERPPTTTDDAAITRVEIIRERLLHEYREKSLEQGRYRTAQWYNWPNWNNYWPNFNNWGGQVPRRAGRWRWPGR